MEKLEFDVVMGKAGRGRTRYLIKKAADSIVAQEEQSVIFVTDEQTPEFILGAINSIHDIENLRNNFTIIQFNDSSDVESALETIDNKLKLGKVVLLIDIHNNSDKFKILKFIQGHPQRELLDFTLSVQLADHTNVEDVREAKADFDNGKFNLNLNQ